MSKRGRPSTISTSMPVGFWRRGNPHPEIDDKFFSGYIKSNGSLYEYWVTADKLESIKSRDRSADGTCIPTQTGMPIGTYKQGDRHPSEDRMFFGYVNGKERWLKPDTFKRTRAKASEYSRARKAKTRNCDRGTLWLYLIRDLKNKAHGKIMYHVDHIIPISKGGSHDIDNLQLATAEWNLKKSNSLM